MMDLETRLGPATLRVWGLIANFAGNAALLYGAIGYVVDGSRLPWLLVGGAVTLVSVLSLSSPSR